ncbi:unnamed protein product [Taenia asiatica]|uniref:Ovule protein n=1 Tax=Taenia asiatica TaxID=60517 RepID=A0A0R3WEC9_TAEAS|nr:unnamed protein product [Taenia asiatica]
MHPFIVAMGPGIRKLGAVPVFHQVDVYALVCLLLKIYKPTRSPCQISAFGYLFLMLVLTLDNQLVIPHQCVEEDPYS